MPQDEKDQKIEEQVPADSNDNVEGRSGEADAEEAAREAFFAEIEKRAEKATRQAIEAARAERNRGGDTAPTTNNPTLNALARERAVLEEDDRKLQALIDEKGLTPELLAKRQDLYDRKSDFRARALLEGQRHAERQREIESYGKEKEWKKFVEDRPGQDLDLLREVFENRVEKTKKSPKRDDSDHKERQRADLSGHEMSAKEVKAKTISRAEVKRQKAAMEEEGDYDGIAKLDRSIRTRAIILKD